MIEIYTLEEIMDPLSGKIRKMIASKQLKINMSEVARVTGVSTSQLRYW